MTSAQSTAVPLSILVVGASGDLAQRKVLPALFALYCQDFLPERFEVIGFARRPMTDEAFRNFAMERLTCRYTPGQQCADSMDRFLSRCHYVAGEYGSRDAFLDLYARMRGLEETAHKDKGVQPLVSEQANRIYYMAIPPFLFMDVARSLGDAGLVSCGDGGPGWSRAVIEKPFGRDRASSYELVENMGQVFTEDQTYRIDHYLGKEIVQNLLVLRFANLIFDPIWNRAHVDHVRIAWKEDLGVEDRGGYFDAYGIVRDVMQNHLVQILALIAMERPMSFDAQHVRDEKVKVLNSVAPLILEDVVLGQYQAATFKGTKQRAYLEEPLVAAHSRTPTYAAAVLHVNNPRWEGIPFWVTAGKGLDERLAEIRIRFRSTGGDLFRPFGGNLPPNELVIRVQPDEAIDFRIVNKAPGLEMRLVESALDLRYASAFDAKIPDAYECLLLDVIRGDKSLFIRSDELAAAWDIFTPVLQEIEQRGVAPEPYAFGSQGPEKAQTLAARYGV